MIKDFVCDEEMVGKDPLHPETNPDRKESTVELLPYSCRDQPSQKLNFKGA